MGSLFSSPGSNHSSNSFSDSGSSPIHFDVLIKTKLLRDEARQLHFEAKATSEQSQSEYSCGRKSEAKALSFKKAALYEQMNEKNYQAAELIFKHSNHDRPDNVIDLHGLYVTEALKYLQRKIDECRSKNILQLTVITGIGNNSPQKLAKIKPEVEKFANKNHLKMIPYGGHVVIDLTSDGQYESANYRDTNGCIIQ